MAIEFMADGRPIPPKSQVGALIDEIAGEGQKVLLSNGEEVNWTPPPAKPIIPDVSQVKSLRKYFNRTGFQAFPAWLYHPTLPRKIVKNQEEANQLGVRHRATSPDELARWGKHSTWDWDDDCLWRPHPYEGNLKFDPENPGPGKTYIPPKETTAQSQRALADAFVKALQQFGGSAPEHTGIPQSDWNEFLRFQAWKKASEKSPAPVVEADSELEDSDMVSWPTERRELESEAASLGLKIDRRWGNKRLRNAIEEAGNR